MLDFTQLHNEFNSFWIGKDYQSALQNLGQIDNYISDGANDTFLVPYNYILQPENLLSLYASQMQQDIATLINNIHYTDLISWFKSYLDGLITEITDFQKKLAAENAKSSFDQILDAIASAISSPYVWIVGGLLILYLIFK